MSLACPLELQQDRALPRKRIRKRALRSMTKGPVQPLPGPGCSVLFCYRCRGPCSDRRKERTASTCEQRGRWGCPAIPAVSHWRWIPRQPPLAGVPEHRCGHGRVNGWDDLVVVHTRTSSLATRVQIKSGLVWSPNPNPPAAPRTMNKNACKPAQTSAGRASSLASPEIWPAPAAACW